VAGLATRKLPIRAEPVAHLPVPPHSVAAEQALLGSLLIDHTAWARISGIVRASDFFRPDHREIFETITGLAGRGQAHDVLTVSECLRSAGRLEAVGGQAYLSQIARDTSTAANAGAYAQIVRDYSAKRALASFAADTERSLVEGRGRSADELIAEATERLLALQTTARAGKGLVSSEDLARELIDDLDSRRDRSKGLEIGLADFDALTCGLEPGDLVVIAGRPGMGKTALLVSIGAHVSQHQPVAVFSAEMSSRQLMRRGLALLGGIIQGKLRRASVLTDEDWSVIGPAATQLARRRFWVDDTALPSVTHIRAESLALKARAGLGLVLVDYVQLVEGRGANRYEQLRDVAYGCKALAKDLAVPVILLAQLNRDVESRVDKRPHLSDLRDSGAIEEAADIVGLLYSEAYYTPDFGMPYVLECRIDKHRNGERGECLWRFDGACSRVTVLEEGARAQYRLRRANPRRSGSTNEL